MISVPLWLTQAHQCSYLIDQEAQSAVVAAGFEINTAIYSQLIEQGFRRSGNQVYKPYCANCQACVPTRIAVKEFQPNRSQTRCWQRNQQLKIQIKPAQFDSRHYQLYQTYQYARHTSDCEKVISEQDYIQFLSSSWCKTWFVEFSNNDQLAAVAIIDVLDNALSAVYTFFDPAFANSSLGVFAVLWQIKQAEQLNLDYVYLGFWIQNCRKMQYKIQYQPLQGLINNNWQTIIA
jgi:leucyl-tRNA---protein transferase